MGKLRVRARRGGVPLVLYAALLPAMLQPSAARAAQASLIPDKDNSIYQESENSNGAGIYLFSGNTDFDAARRALLRFDVAGSIPGGSTITSVGLSLTCNRSSALLVATHPFSLRALSADWGEAGSNGGNPGGTGAAAAVGDATWTQRHFGMNDPWTTPGGDFDPTVSGSASVGDCTPAVTMTFSSTSQMVADVQGWLDDPCSNHGWILIGDEVALQTARRFASREASAAEAPRLVVDFTAPSAGVGAVPDGVDVPGAPMTVVKLPGGQIQLDWSASCLPDDDYAVYEGQLGRFYSHAPVVCSTGGATGAAVQPGFDGAYYLVAPTRGGFEGSYGKNSDGEERPRRCGACFPRALSDPVCP